MIKKFINKTIDKLLRRNLNYHLAFANIQRQVIHQKIAKQFLIDKTLYFNNYNDYILYCMRHSEPYKNKLIMEFGIEDGGTGKLIANFFNNEKVYGFDSFEGFKEIDTSSYWYKYQKLFKNQIIPLMPKNYEITIGFIENTLLKFQQNHNLNNYDSFFIHCDVDIYEPTKVILKEILKYKKKTFIMFDDFMNYDGFEKYEYRAFNEEVENSLDYKFICYTDKGNERWDLITKVFVEIY